MRAPITSRERLLRTSRLAGAPSVAGRSRERYRRIALGSAAGVGARAVQLLVGLVTVPLTLRYLGQERYGMWVTMSSLVAMIGFADLGIGYGLLNAVAEANGRRDRAAAAAAVSSAFFVLLVLAGAAGAAVAVAYRWVPWPRLFNVTSALASREAGPAVATLAACYLAGLPVTVVQRVRTGFQETHVDAAWVGAGSLIGLAALMLAIRLEAGLPWLVLALAGAPVLAQALQGVDLLARKRRWLLPRLRGVTRAGLRAVAGAGAYFFLLQVAAAFAYQSDAIIVAQILGAHAVTQYAVPMKLFMLVPVLLGFVLTPLWPAYREAFARGDSDWSRAAFRRSLALAMGAGVPGALALFVLGRPLVRAWVGDAVAPGAGLLAAMAIWSVMLAASNAISAFLNGAGRLRVQAACAIAMMAGNVTLSIVLTRRIGVAGVVWGTVIAQTAFVLLPLAFYLRRTLAPAAVEAAAEDVEWGGEA